MLIFRVKMVVSTRFRSQTSKNSVTAENSVKKIFRYFQALTLSHSLASLDASGLRLSIMSPTALHTLVNLGYLGLVQSLAPLLVISYHNILLQHIIRKLSAIKYPLVLSKQQKSQKSDFFDEGDHEGMAGFPRLSLLKNIF